MILKKVEILGIISDRKSNQIRSSYWDFMNDRRQRSEIPSVLEHNAQTVNAEALKGELFAGFLESHYTPSDDIEVDSLLNE